MFALANVRWFSHRSSDHRDWKEKKKELIGWTVTSVHEVENVPRLDSISRAMIEAAVEEKTKHHEIIVSRDTPRVPLPHLPWWIKIRRIRRFFSLNGRSPRNSQRIKSVLFNFEENHQKPYNIDPLCKQYGKKFVSVAKNSVALKKLYLLGNTSSRIPWIRAKRCTNSRSDEPLSCCSKPRLANQVHHFCSTLSSALLSFSSRSAKTQVAR